MRHESETKVCQSCKKDFTIEPEDFGFYEKMKVPPPTWCPECRMVRRLAFVDTWSVFLRNCDKCSKKILSMYPPEQKVVSYCPSCFWADDWDGTEYALDYDPKRPFLYQIKELREKVPFLSLDVNHTTIKNSEYSNGISWCKNCYLTFWADYCEDVYYSSLLKGLKHSADCIRGYDSELCYESIGFTKNYKTFFSDECDNCVDVWFSRNCYSCTNCIGCVNLRGASNYIFNVKYSKEEYDNKLRELNLESWSSLQRMKEKAHKFWFTKPYREYNGHSLNLNVTGEHVYTSKNSKEIYLVNGAENCKWCQFISVPTAKDCMDYSGWGNNAELIYECPSVGENASQVKFSAECFPDSLNLEYCLWCIAGKNNFGCVSLKRKQYAILNKIYPKEEYEALKEKIIEEMKVNPYIDNLGRKYYYGEFFPPELSLFPYNKSNAQKFFPKTKEEALKEGYIWSEEDSKIYNTTLNANLLPDRIVDTRENILDEIIKCDSCANGYRIAKGEFDLLRKMNLPVPHQCPKCRENERFNRMTKPGMYHRNCAKCGTKIYTPYAPGRPEIVYCVNCYQGEFL